MLPTEVAEQLFAGRVILGRFRLDRELGRGGMGTVWEARHISLEAQVAIKFLKSELSQRQDIRARFAREATSAARIRSPHIVSILDSGFTDDDFAFIVMELLQGEDLGRQLARRGCYSLDETRSLVAQVARGLEKAHAVGIVHRDLKPENLFVADDEGANVKILDFGIAKAFGPEATTHKTDTGQLLGTPMYMSPEQALGRAVDARSDLYSLAVVAYRCLAGRAPFDHAAHGEMIVAVSTHTPPPPSSFNPALPPEIDAWFAAMLTKDPDSRSSQTALTLGESFERVCLQALNVSTLPRGPSPLPRTHLSGATLGNDAEPNVPSADEVATTMLVPHFSAALSRRPRSRRGFSVGLLSLGVVAGVGVAVLRRPTAPQPSPAFGGESAAHGKADDNVVSRHQARTPAPVATSTLDAPATATTQQLVAAAGGAGPKAKPRPFHEPSPLGHARPTSGTTSEAVDKPVATVEPPALVPANEAALLPVPASPAQAEPKPPVPGIDRTSPWE